MYTIGALMSASINSKYFLYQKLKEKGHTTSATKAFMYVSRCSVDFFFNDEVHLNQITVFVHGNRNSNWKLFQFSHLFFDFCFISLNSTCREGKKYIFLAISKKCLTFVSFWKTCFNDTWAPLNVAEKEKHQSPNSNHSI